MKVMKSLLLVLALFTLLAACNKTQEQQTEQSTTASNEQPTEPETESQTNAIQIVLDDTVVKVNGAEIGSDPAAAVYASGDIVYYEAGKDFTYGEGTDADAHTQEAAAAHTVVHIAKAGTYSISGKLPRGQIAVDLGENAKEDPNAVVTLILNNADITCQVAPAVIFYNVYECANTENPSKDVDTSAAGANVIIADGSTNTVNGAYVARIYKPGTVVLNQQGTAVEDAKKLHKYDGAFYSKMSMNISGEAKNTGILNIFATNEGLDTEMHLTVNGGNINICSGNDGINTNEDGISVTTINAGSLNILVTGETGEGDGIDSNGWLVINGGSVVAAACEKSADAGVDSDMGIYINGGTVFATGSMLDRIEAGGQTYAVFQFAQKQNGENAVSFKDKDGNQIFDHTPQNGYSVLLFSSSELKEGTYTLWSNTQQLSCSMGGGIGMGGHQGGMKPPEGFEQNTRPTPPEGMEPPAGESRPGKPQHPGGESQWRPDQGGNIPQEQTAEFTIVTGANMFGNIAPLV